MDHVAIMKKEWELTAKILSGEKTIESRWYKARYAPWNRISAGDSVYFMDSGKPVAVAADVEKVIQIADLDPHKVRDILFEFGGRDGITQEKMTFFNGLFRHKKYCILVFLSNPRSTRPFRIDKSGFGLRSAWICIDDISKISTS